MFTLVTCPACQHKITVPEGTMGARRICPNCQSPFVAGASVAEAPAPRRQMHTGPLGPPVSGPTLLGEVEPPIRYNCPRCKTPLEAPVSEAGTKKPCPSCGGRLQVPAAPPPPAPTSSPAAPLQRTMLAETQPPIRYNCPNCKKPLESPASEGGTKKPCPACGQRLQVPAAPAASSPAAPQANLNRTMLAADESRSQAFSPRPGQPASYPMASGPTSAAPGSPILAGLLPASPPLRLATLIAGGLLLLLLLGCVLPAVINNGRDVDREARARDQKELEKLRAEMLESKQLLEEQKKLAEEQRRGWEKMLKEQQDKQERLELQRQLDRENEAYRNDKRLRDEAEAKREREQRDIERMRREAEEKRDRESAEAKARIDALQKKLEDANTKATTIVQQPAPVIYHPPYHPYYYRPWWGW